MIIFIVTGIILYSFGALFIYSKNRNPWRLLIAYSSITLKTLVLLIFLELASEVRYLSEIILIFLFLNTGGTIIAAFFLGMRDGK
ncbi:MAG: hypothetical protein DRP32_04200 [Thermotogae bacterium]|uniref:hypothetical protein n=1 Tax=Kosmotoga sp. TaxID=1955248 RepID=UPI000F20B403|nr:hypothetical protein [Kosmotoga sp.]MBO8166741.1 hypothetical protein [Kosmotoga sp.]RKX49817.1 MAG: hypothetical protein DRP32_04200 [Thermotogota bacterium]